MLKFIINLGIVALAALFQTTNFAFIGEVKPNFSLVIVLFMCFLYKDWLKRAILIFVAAFILKFTPGLEIENVIFILSTVTGAFLLDFLPPSPVLNLFILTEAVTALFNLSHFNLQVFLKESLYNLAMLSVCLATYNLWREK